jgi:PAS domain S-box-containing protein
MADDVGMHEPVEAALRKSELRLRTLVGAVSAITWSCPSSGLHVEPQPEWMAFTGQTAEEMLGDGWNSAVHPEDRAAALSEWREAVARGEPYAGEERIRRHDRQWRWMSVRAAPIRDAGGEIVEWFGMCIDITEQKHAAEALRESEERFRLFMDNSPTLAWVKDDEGRYVYLGRTYGPRFGVQAADRLGKTDAELWPPDVAAEFRRNDLAVLTTGQTIQTVEETREPDGSRCCWLSTKFPFRDAAGKRYVGGIGLEITERIKMEAALGASERRFRAIFNNQCLYIVLVSPEGRIVEMSDSILRGTGVSPEEAIGELFVDGPWWRDLPEMRARWRRQFEQALARQAPSQDEAEYRTKDGELRHALNTVTALRDEQGELEFFLCEGLDITERKRAENALRESEERLRRVSNNADVGLIRCSRDWIYLSANPAYAKIVGKPLDQIVGRPLAEVMGAEAAETIRPFVERALRGEGLTYEAELPYDHAGDRCLQISYTPDTDAAGQIVGWIACITDITERKRAENALRASERRFRAIFKHQLAYSALLSPEGRLIEASDVALRAAGVALEEITGLLFLDGPWWRDLPEVRARWRRQFEEALTQSSPSRDEVEYRTGDGVLRYALNSVTALRDEHGELEYFLCEGIDITERKRVENALRESEERLRLALDASRAGCWAWDAKSSVSKWDERFRALYDFPPGAPSRFEEWIERLHPEDRARILSRIEALSGASGDDHWSEEFRSLSPEGRVRWHQNLGQAQRDAAGALLTVVGIDLDITQRKEAEEALRRSEEINRRTLQALPAHIAVLDRNGQILATNQAWDDFASQNGAANESSVAVGANYLEACRRAAATDDSAKLALEGVEDVIEGRRSLFTLEYPCHSAERQRWFFVTVAPLGSDRGAVVTHMNVTARRQAQESLEHTRKQLAEGQRIAHVGSWEFDAATQTTIWSDEEKRIYGLDPAARSPDYAALLRQHIHPDDAPQLDERFRAALQQGATFENEHRIVLPDGSVRWIYDKAQPYFDERGRLTRYIGATLDITERRAAEEALREADRRKDEFLATLAHELRNPLAPIRNGLDALRRVGANAPSADRLLVTMAGQADHLIRLVDDLMDLSRITRGKFELQKQRIDLAAVLGQAVNMSRHFIEAEGLELRLNLCCKPTPVDGDAVRLTQVFANLLNNAARHTKRGGRIQIALERVGDEALVRVADTGAGISKELLPHIFDPFVQGGGKGGGARQGLGIGLALVREITQMHGGAVEARSDGEGLGSAFILRLPLLETETTEAPAPASAPARLKTAPRVLVIDDMPKVAEALAFLLNVLGATVRVAHSGAQGLEICAEFEPELVLLDLSMPKMDGFETARRLQELPAGRKARLIALTGFGEEQARARTKEAGFESHLVKPARLKQLEELLASVSAGTGQETTAE